jgi:hypothetical protein
LKSPRAAAGLLIEKFSAARGFKKSEARSQPGLQRSWIENSVTEEWHCLLWERGRPAGNAFGINAAVILH